MARPLPRVRALGLAGSAWLACAAAPAWANRPSWQEPPPQFLPIEAQWCLDPGHCIQLEVADEPHEQAKGLQLRPRLPALRGMWFPFERATPLRFWMHRTPEPLDMVFLRAGRVVAIERRVQPCMYLPCPSYGPDEPSDGVVELAAGEAERLGITPGFTAVINRSPISGGASSQQLKRQASARP